MSVIVLSTKGDSPEKGYVRYVGETDFASGIWIGVQLDNPKGKNNGTVHGYSYFDCRPLHGVFVRHDRLLSDKRRPKKTFPVPTRKAAKSPTPSKLSPVIDSTPSYLKPTQSSRSKIS